MTTPLSQKQFLFAVFSETLPDGSSRLSIETSIKAIRPEDISFSGLDSRDILILNQLLRGEEVEEKGIHHPQMQYLAEKGIITWTSSGWAMTEELRRMAACEMLGKGE